MEELTRTVDQTQAAIEETLHRLKGIGDVEYDSGHASSTYMSDDGGASGLSTSEGDSERGNATITTPGVRVQPTERLAGGQLQVRITAPNRLAPFFTKALVAVRSRLGGVTGDMISAARPALTTAPETAERQAGGDAAPSPWRPEVEFGLWALHERQVSGAPGMVAPAVGCASPKGLCCWGRARSHDRPYRAPLLSTRVRPRRCAALGISSKMRCAC